MQSLLYVPHLFGDSVGGACVWPVTSRCQQSLESSLTDVVSRRRNCASHRTHVNEHVLGSKAISRAGSLPTRLIGSCVTCVGEWGSSGRREWKRLVDETPPAMGHFPSSPPSGPHPDSEMHKLSPTRRFPHRTLLFDCSICLVRMRRQTD